MNDCEKIKNFVDSSAEIYPRYIFNQLKKDYALKFIMEIISNSGKEISEAVLAFLSAVKFTYKKEDVFTELEETDAFQNYVEENADLLLKISIEKKVQGNVPGRAFPILEVLSKKIGNSNINLIELGASFGLIGRCLLNHESIIGKKERYFPSRQQLPENPKGIDYYLGIELNIPSAEWMLASVWEKEAERRLKNFIEDYKNDNRFELLHGDAFGFSKLEAIKRLAEKAGTIIILTSFMLYQFDDKRKRILTDEIFNFVNSFDGHWINQDVNISQESKMNEYYIAWDNKKIIELSDDWCFDWKWLND